MRLLGLITSCEISVSSLDQFQDYRLGSFSFMKIFCVFGSATFFHWEGLNWGKKYTHTKKKALDFSLQDDNLVQKEWSWVREEGQVSLRFIYFVVGQKEAQGLTGYSWDKQLLVQYYCFCYEMYQTDQ